MHTRLDRERRSFSGPGRDDKTSIDRLEHVRGGIQVESSVEMRLQKDVNLESPEWCTPEIAADTSAPFRRGSRPRRR